MQFDSGGHKCAADVSPLQWRVRGGRIVNKDRNGPPWRILKAVQPGRRGIAGVGVPVDDDDPLRWSRGKDALHDAAVDVDDDRT